MISSRRSFITGLAALVAAPAIVRVASLMPVRGIVMPITYQGVLLEFDQPHTFTVLYSNPEYMPVYFSGFLPLVEMPHDHA